MTHLFEQIVTIVVVFAFAIALSQIPTFVQQYEQRLGGALDELTAMVEADLAAARRSGVSLEQSVRDHLESDRQTIRDSGRAIAARMERMNELSRAAQRLAAAAKPMKPLVLMQVFDRKVLAGAWDLYRLTLTFDPLFGVVGAALGLLVNAGIGWILFGPVAARPRRRG